MIGLNLIHKRGVTFIHGWFGLINMNRNNCKDTFWNQEPIRKDFGRTGMNVGWTECKLSARYDAVYNEARTFNKASISKGKGYHYAQNKWMTWVPDKNLLLSTVVQLDSGLYRLMVGHLQVKWYQSGSGIMSSCPPRLRGQRPPSDLQ